MNIAFHLTLKSEVIFEHMDSTMRQLMERMDYHNYSAIPILDQEGKYLGTISEGDILRKIRSFNDGELFKHLELIQVKDIPRRKSYEAVSINANMQDLYDVVIHQNFVPVIDDQGIFIGIITRSAVIARLETILKEEKPCTSLQTSI